MNESDAISAIDDSAWSVVVTARRDPLDLGVRELWRYRDLIALFVRRNFVVYYRQTVLGPVWYVIQPLTTTAVFTVIFGLIAGIPTDRIAPTLFYMSGVIIWSNFSANVVMTSDVFIANSAMFGKVYFPRLAVPIATVFTNFISLALQLAVFVVLYAVEVSVGRAQPPSLAAIFVLPLFAINALIALGFGLLFSGLTTRYRDLIQVLGFGIQLWMYATPVIYPLSQIPERWRILAALNPVSTTIELFRLFAFGNGTVSATQIAVSAVAAAAVLFAGLATFNKAAMKAADTV